MAFNGFLTLISRISVNRSQESPNSRKIDLAPADSIFFIIEAQETSFIF